MRKHPVDDLFKRRLTDLEKKPSNNAWLKIQENSEKRRRPVIWIWYAAASVVIALTAGYTVWDQLGGRQQMDSVAHKSIAAKVNKGTPSKSTQTPDLQQAVADKKRVEEKKSDLIDGNDQIAKFETHKKVEHVVSAISEADISKKQKIVILENVEPEPLENVESVAVLPKIEIAKRAEEALAIDNRSKPQPEPAITIVVAVETNDELEEKPKSSKFSRVFRQLKNARAGERVDWDEVGFNPKSLVARVDDRLRNKEDGRNTEKIDNPKQRTKL